MEIFDYMTILYPLQGNKIFIIINGLQNLYRYAVKLILTNSNFFTNFAFNEKFTKKRDTLNQ
jgi:hypothetical protein